MLTRNPVTLGGLSQQALEPMTSSLDPCTTADLPATALGHSAASTLNRTEIDHSDIGFDAPSAEEYAYLPDSPLHAAPACDSATDLLLNPGTSTTSPQNSPRKLHGGIFRYNLGTLLVQPLSWSNPSPHLIKIKNKTSSLSRSGTKPTEYSLRDWWLRRHDGGLRVEGFYYAHHFFFFLNPCPKYHFEIREINSREVSGGGGRGGGKIIVNF